MHFRGRGAAVAAVVAVSVLIGSGCTHAASGPEVLATSPATSDSPGTSLTVPAATPSGGPGAAVVRMLSLGAGPLRPGYTVSLIQDGDQVNGQVTLDYCGAEFASEADRLARYQVGITDASGNNVVSVESVFYEPGGATRALRELRVAIAACNPSSYVSSNVAGVPPLRYETIPLPAQETTGLAPDRVAILTMLVPESGGVQIETMIYQRRGQVLVGTYGENLLAVVAFARVEATKLAALTPAQAGQG